jgi:hypothetical protein
MSTDGPRELVSRSAKLRKRLDSSHLTISDILLQQVLKRSNELRTRYQLLRSG